MKKIFTLKTYCVISTILWLLMFTVVSFAQSFSTGKTTVSLVNDDADKITIKFEAGKLIQKRVNTDSGEAVIINIDQGTPMLEKGFPDLPKLTASIIVPDDKSMEVSVTGSLYTDYENIIVAPSKGSLKRDIDPASVAYNYGEAYRENNFFPRQLAALREPYILRDFRGQTVIVCPLQYNAVTKTFRVYSEITVTIFPDTQPAINVFHRNAGIEIKTDPEFNRLYSNQFLNFEKDTRYNPLEEEGNMLIISSGPFMNAMQPLVDWKIQRGMHTEMVDVATIGNDKTSIKNYVANFYNTHGLTYLLLAGDAAQVAAGSTSAGDADNDYGYISGEDHYQEIFVGRFSAESESDIINQVNKTISYEKTPLNDDHFAKGICIASNEGGGIGDDGEADYEHQDLIRTQLLGYNYTDVAALFDGTHGNADAPGNPVANDLSTLIDNGTGIISYTGHGSGSSLSTTDFSITDANNLTNTTQWPFVWVVGCSVGNFTGTTCLAESFARSNHNGLPTGTVASFMSTILQAWAEPMEAQDEMHSILSESYTGNIKRTFGGLSVNGCFSMNDKYGATGYNMTDTWIVFGDPSLEIRTAQPTPMLAVHNPTIELGSTHFIITCDAENALACLSVNGNILATATITSGLADLSFDPLIINDTLTLTITGYNKTPYIAAIPATQPAGPFVFNGGNVINDITGNYNGLADFNEAITLDVTLQNLGLTAAVGVTATIATSDPFINITDAAASYNTIQSNTAVIQTNAFAFTVGDNVPDGHVAFFSCIITDSNSNTWSSSFSILLNAPLPAVNSLVINDAIGGNGDGYLDPSETAIVTISTSNNGHSDIGNAIATLSSNSNFITVSSATYNIGNLNAGENQTATFEITVAPAAIFGIDVILTCDLMAGAYSSSNNFITVISPAIEDFETNDFTSYEWQLSGIVNWFTTTENAYEGSYCTKSGNVNNFQSTTLEIVLPVQFEDEISFAHKVSSEAGYDSLAFYIDGVVQNSWSGESAWAVSSYAIDSGLHNFKWVYAKDGYFS
ncbi:MAG: C25 family cysteine peptidase, partial [Chitinophagales bacterium]